MTIRKKKKVVKKKTTNKKKTAKQISPKERAAINADKAINIPEKYVFGRPSEYDRSYPERVYNACVRGDCLTLASICCMLEICRPTLKDWIEKYKDFSYAIKKGTEFRKMHMEEKGMKGMNRGKNFNGLPWLFLIKNMFPDEYSDRKEITVGNKDDKSFSFAFDLSEEPKK